MVTTAVAGRNGILAAMPPDVIGRLGNALELVALERGVSLYEPAREVPDAYFPLDAIVSMWCLLRSGATAEVAVVGKEGMLGVAIVMGSSRALLRAVVQVPGHALRLSAAALAREFRRANAFHDRLLRYALALMTQIMQTAVCNRHHTLEQQLCRWLLMTLDRSSRDELTMTQELIAQTLGVGRPRVSVVAAKLQEQGLVEYSRGRIKVIARERLEAYACECYGAVQKEYKRLLAPPSAPFPLGRAQR